LKKNERITNVFRIADVQSTQQFGIRRLKGKRYNAGADEMKNIPAGAGMYVMSVF